MRSLCLFVVLVSSLASAPTSATGQAAPPTSAVAGTCGNKLLDAGESCTQCPGDCTAQPCQPAKSGIVFAVEFTPPAAPDVSTALLRIGYRTDRISLPGSGGEKSVQSRIKRVADTAMLVPNDLDYALRLVVGRPGGIPAGRLLTIEFDRCQGAAAPAPSDLSCEVETCASSTGAVDTCRCQITAIRPGN